jgi:demethylmenaquinone methyltransferase/2-methoxy-6-polyprenyl-1,4-benzoquinol methylase
MNPSVPKPDKEAKKIQAMFGRIAKRYDLLNHVLSGWTDVDWRRFTAREALVHQPKRILDIACGTGDLALELKGQAGTGAQVVGADFTFPMLQIAGEKSSSIPWVQADGLRLPFPDASFDLVTVAFGLRNMESWEGGIREMARVLAPGGRAVVLEFSQPENALIRAVFLPYFVHVLPRIAGLLSEGRAYSYLSHSVMHFPGRRKLATMMKENGFPRVRHCALSFGIAALHVGIK